MRRIIDSDFLHEWRKEPWFVALGIVPMCILGMLLAAVMDGELGLPTFVWVSTWVGITLAAPLIPQLSRLSPTMGMDSGHLRRYREYMALSKSERALLPANTPELLRHADYDALHAYDRAYSKVEELRRLKGAGTAKTVAAAFTEAADALDIDLQVQKEYR